MKKVRILSMILAMLMVAFCFVACNGNEDPSAQNPSAGNNPTANQPTIKIGVYSTFDPKTNVEGEVAIFGALDGYPFTIDNPTPLYLVEQLAKLRKATLVTTTGGIDSITFNRVIYRSGKILDTSKTHVIKVNGVDTEVYLYNFVSWQVTVNDAPAEMDTPLKEGDSVIIKLVREPMQDEYELVEDDAE